MKLFDVRDEYHKEAFIEATLEATPQQQFEKWFQTAVKANCDKPTAMTLSTVSVNGQPRGRIVLLKEMRTEGFVFFTNYDSIKGQHIGENPKASLCFYWSELERQVLIQGELTKVSREESATYFNSRPLDSQISAAVSAQSSAVESRQTLLDQANELANSLNEGELPECPTNWGGYILKPTVVEFWQGRPDRMHDRFEYSRQGSSWVINRLAP